MELSPQDEGPPTGGRCSEPTSGREKCQHQRMQIRRLTPALGAEITGLDLTSDFNDFPGRRLMYRVSVLGATQR